MLTQIMKCMFDAKFDKLNCLIENVWMPMLESIHDDYFCELYMILFIRLQYNITDMTVLNVFI